MCTSVNVRCRSASCRPVRPGVLHLVPWLSLRPRGGDRKPATLPAWFNGTIRRTPREKKRQACRESPSLHVLFQEHCTQTAVFLQTRRWRTETVAVLALHGVFEEGLASIWLGRSVRSCHLWRSCQGTQQGHLLPAALIEWFVVVLGDLPSRHVWGGLHLRTGTMS